eukprot:8366847-Alexandrium_andersonii.AAC.1
MPSLAAWTRWPCCSVMDFPARRPAACPHCPRRVRYAAERNPALLPICLARLAAVSVRGGHVGRRRTVRCA